jgi:inorganic triphosphatase YgiF
VNVETEIKLSLESALHGKRLLKRARFRLRKRRALEENTLFDTARGTLRRDGAALRIRQSRGRVTHYKGRCAGKHNREELEAFRSQ